MYAQFRSRSTCNAGTPPRQHTPARAALSRPGPACRALGLASRQTPHPLSGGQLTPPHPRRAASRRRPTASRQPPLSTSVQRRTRVRHCPAPRPARWLTRRLSARPPTRPMHSKNEPVPRRPHGSPTCAGRPARTALDPPTPPHARTTPSQTPSPPIPSLARRPPRLPNATPTPSHTAPPAGESARGAAAGGRRAPPRLPPRARAQLPPAGR